MSKYGLRLPRALPFGAFIKSMRQTVTTDRSRGANIIDTELCTGEHIPITIHNGRGYDIATVSTDDEAGHPASVDLVSQEEADGTGDKWQALHITFHNLAGTIAHFLTGTPLDNNEPPTVTEGGSDRERTVTLSLPRAKGITCLPATTVTASTPPAVSDEGNVNETALHFSLPAAWGVDMSVNTTVLAPGAAPTASVTATDDGAVRHFTLNLGISPGLPFAIAKTYPTIAALLADYDTADVQCGQFAIIDTGNVDDADNAKLFLKGESAWELITDLSGATGMRGPTGATGHTPLVTITAGDDAGSVGTPSVTQTTDSNGDTAVVLHCIKGADGADGAPGKDGKDGTMRFADLTDAEKATLKGEKGADGAPGTAGATFSWDDATDTLTIATA